MARRTPSARSLVFTKTTAARSEALVAVGPGRSVNVGDSGWIFVGVSVGGTVEEAVGIDPRVRLQPDNACVPRTVPTIGTTTRRNDLRSIA
jgi:hypothetical protein